MQEMMRKTTTPAVIPTTCFLFSLDKEAGLEESVPEGTPLAVETAEGKKE
jgi:hypothetical protein